MISAVFLHKERCPNTLLLEKLARFCPQVEIQAQVSNLEHAVARIQVEKPQLIFFDLEDCLSNALKLICYTQGFDFETIVFSPCRGQFLEAIKHCALGYILKPVETEELILTIRHAEKRILAREESQNSKHPQATNMGTKQVIGIPTIDGYEFLSIEDIIRCEGYQKCTRVITKNRKSVVSSYNLGEFIKILKPFRFYSPHKSHIINLAEILRYYREGRAQMSDLSEVPIARRRRQEFLDLLLHL